MSLLQDLGPVHCANTLLVVASGDGDFVGALIDAGIPADGIRLDSQARTTREQVAQCLGSLLPLIEDP